MHPDSYAGSKGDETFFKDHPISADVYARVLDRLNEVKQKVDSGEVKYQAFRYNCAAFVRDITRTAGLPFPGSKVIPFIFHGKASAFTPNRLFSALNKQYSKGGSGVYHIDDPDAGLGGEPAEATDEEVEDLFAQMRANKAAKQPGGNV